jgi:hypothetical protein
MFVVGIAITVALVLAAVAAWPDDEGPQRVAGADTPTTLMTKEAAAALPLLPSSPELPTTETTIAVDLFAVGPGAAVDDVLAAADHPTELIQITIFPGYLFVAYRDPHETDAIDRRMWRGGIVDPADANPIDDRVDPDTTPQLFGLGDIDLSRIAGLVADAPTRYDVPVEVTHVIIDRFLPFDQRVLVRVYAQPTDGRSGGGYVSYTKDGTFVKACC